MKKVDARVSPSLHPSLADEAADHPNTRAVAQLVRGRLGDMYTRMSKFHDEIGSVQADPQLSDAGKREKQAELRGRLLAEVRPKLHQVTKQVQDSKAAAERRLADAVRPEHKSASEDAIRSYVRDLSGVGERISFLMGKARANDRETVNAVVQSRPYLSGFDSLPPDRWERIQSEARRALEPEMAEHLDVLERLSSRLENAQSAVERI